MLLAEDVRKWEGQNESNQLYVIFFHFGPAAFKMNQTNICLSIMIFSLGPSHSLSMEWVGVLMRLNAYAVDRWIVTIPQKISMIFCFVFVFLSCDVRSRKINELIHRVDSMQKTRGFHATHHLTLKLVLNALSACSYHFGTDV